MLKRFCYATVQKRRIFNELIIGSSWKSRSYLLAIGMLVQCFLPETLTAQSGYLLKILWDQNNSSRPEFSLKTNFPNRQECLNYVYQIDSILSEKGYASASLDSLDVQDSVATAFVYLGQKYEWEHLQINGLTAQEEQSVLFSKKPRLGFFNQRQLQVWQNQVLAYLFDHGYPFASVKLDSLQIVPAEQVFKVSAKLVVEKGLLYKLDSIRVLGNASISPVFLHRYLDLPAGMPFQKSAFNTISTRINELPYLKETEPWSLRFGGNGAILDLHLEPKKSSQINVLLGLLPTVNSLGENKVQVTGEANLNLKNALGGGETIGVNWQQLQVQSPRLHLLFQQPYLFGSAFGISTQFDLFKKDSSFLTINGHLGVQYAVSAKQSGTVFLQLFRTNLLDVDTFSIKRTRQLPNDRDVSVVNLGVDYVLNTTNYRRNPRRGWELNSVVTAGTRTIRPNNAVLEIKDPSFNYAGLYDTVPLKSYQFKINVRLAKYLPLGRQATVQLLSTAGWVQSPSIYRNELFQIGGYKLMRGFDEESIFASRYLVNTLEYRYLIGMNSYFFGFFDLGFTRNTAAAMLSQNRFWGTGLGMAFETKAGFFNLSLAAGKRDDTPFNLRQTKIHLGYVNYF